MASYDVASNIRQVLNSGEPGIVRLILRDRFGNAVAASRALFTFEGRASGPGGVAVELQEAPDGQRLPLVHFSAQPEPFLTQNAP
jgi:hypothetical protein